jgi:hypothetical protein
MERASVLNVLYTQRIHIRTDMRRHLHSPYTEWKATHRLVYIERKATHRLVYIERKATHRLVYIEWKATHRLVYIYRN